MGHSARSRRFTGNERRSGMILAGDVGGTKTHLALYDPGPPLRLSRLETFPSAGFSSLDAMIDRFRGDGAASVAAAALGVAGPVIGATAVLPNLAWSVDAARIAKLLGVPVLTLLNDVEASAWALELLGDDDTALLLPGTRLPNGNQAIISAGTGLGEAVLLRAGTRRNAIASEAGHADFAPRTDLEIELLRWLRERFGRVSWERILSGPGLVDLHRFLAETGRGAEPASVTEAIREGDAAAAISTAALD